MCSGYFMSYGQVVIGTDLPAMGTLLHVEDISGEKGVLFPSAALTDLTTIAPFPAGTPEGTLIYNINGVIGTGYYYWTQTKWQRLNANTGSMAKFINSQSYTGSNLHQASYVKANIFGESSDAPVFNDDIDIFNRVDSGTLEILADGRYQITINLAMTAIESPAQVEVQLRINTTDQGAFYRSTEMLANSTQPENGNVSFTQTLELKSGNKLSVISRKTESTLTGFVYLRSAGTSSFFIEKLL
jgi:hypothetical protein